MINFEEELKHFKPMTEIVDAEDAIHKMDVTDITDIIAELMRKQKDVQKKKPEGFLGI